MCDGYKEVLPSSTGLNIQYTARRLVHTVPLARITAGHDMRMQSVTVSSKLQESRRESDACVPEPLSMSRPAARARSKKRCPNTVWPPIISLKTTRSLEDHDHDHDRPPSPLLKRKRNVNICSARPSNQRPLPNTFKQTKRLTGSLPLVLVHLALPVRVHDVHALEERPELRVLLVLLEDLVELLLVLRVQAVLFR